MKVNKSIIILGPQGSGKGTQAALIRERLGFDLFVMGDLLREIAKQDTELGRKVHETINVRGDLVEPDLAVEVMFEKLRGATSDQGIIIDSFPRNLDQYKGFKQKWPRLKRGDYAVLFIELSDEEAVRRLSKRYICDSCGKVYVGKVFDVCDKCGGRIIQREDDKSEKIKNRLGWFKTDTIPMTREMEKDGARIIRINGEQTVEEVHREIMEKLATTDYR